MKTPADYYRSLERLIEENPHQVFIIQDRRALHNEARAQGVEFMVGGEPTENLRCPTCGQPGKIHQDKFWQKNLLRCWDGHIWDKTKLPTHSGGPGQDTVSSSLVITKSQEPDLMIDLEKAKKDEDVFPHKYASKHRSPGGNLVYIYAQDREGGTNRSTGFEGAEAKKKEPEPPKQGQKRKGMKEALADSPSWLQEYSKAGLEIPQSTQKVISEATKLVGPEQFEQFVNNVAARHPDVKKPLDQAFMVEAVARDIFARYSTAKNPSDEIGDTERKQGNRPGGYMPTNPAFKKPWQMSPEEFGERKSLNPKLGEGKDHRQHVEEAAERGESVPWQAIKPYSDLAETYKDKKPALKLSPETEEYVKKFRDLTADIPTRFDSWVRPEIRKDGDQYLTGEKASGYNIDQYDVADGGVYSHIMTSKDPVIMYHMYAQNKAHGEELLALMHEHGLNPKYTVIKRASAVLWEDDWGPLDKEMSGRDIETPQGKKKIAYSSDYILAFKPRNDDEAKAISEAVIKNTSLGAHADKAIHHSYYVPDVRASQPVEGFDHAHLNVKQVGSQELCILTKHDWIRAEKKAASSPDEAKEQGDYDDGFDRFDVYLNPEFKAFIKSVRVTLFKSKRFPGDFLFVNVEGLE